MIRPGFATTDPVTQTRIVLVKGAEETAGRGWVTEVHCPEGAAASVAPHMHRTWTETFEILQGSAMYRLGSETKTLAAGERIAMPPGVVHVHPWNTGPGTMIFRHTSEFGASTPDAVHDVIGTFATINELARQGKTGKQGMPKNLLQFAATVRTLTKHGAFDASVPIPLQLFLASTLGRLAEGLGYRGVYDRYLV